jgi:large subunit ribosomal protein L14e
VGRSFVRAVAEATPAKEMVGRLAVSRSGRDAGSTYLVVGIEGPTVVFVADGRTRSVGRPKRKNVKHLELGALVPQCAERIASGQALTDEEVRAAIAAALVSG